MNTHATSDCRDPKCPRCSKCNKKGHEARDCDPKHVCKTNTAPTNTTNTNYKEQKSSRLCIWYKQEGHWDAECIKMKTLSQKVIFPYRSYTNTKHVLLKYDRVKLKDSIKKKILMSTLN